MMLQARPVAKGKLKLHKIRIVPDNEHGLLDVDTAFRLEIEFWNLVPGGFSLNASVLLYTADDICVLNTVSKPASFPIGLVRMVCHFPANLLNSATYRVRLLLVSNTRVLFEDSQTMAFELADGIRLTSWHGKWAGVVRPKLQWDTAAVT